MLHLYVDTCLAPLQPHSWHPHPLPLDWLFLRYMYMYLNIFHVDTSLAPSQPLSFQLIILTILQFILISNYSCTTIQTPVAHWCRNYWSAKERRRSYRGFYYKVESHIWWQRFRGLDGNSMTWKVNFKPGARDRARKDNNGYRRKCRKRTSLL